MKNNKIRRFIASIGVAAMVTSTVTSAVQPAVIYAESPEDLEQQQEEIRTESAQEEGAPVALSEEGEQTEPQEESVGAQTESEPQEESAETQSEAESQEESAGTRTGSESQEESAGAQKGSESGEEASGAKKDSEEKNPARDEKESDASEEKKDAAGEEAGGASSDEKNETVTKEITSVITEDLDLGTYTTETAPAYGELKLPKEIKVKVSEEEETVTVTWNGEENYDSRKAGTYTFDSELDEDWNQDENGQDLYELADDVTLPRATITVEEVKKPQKDDETKAPGKDETAADTKKDPAAQKDSETAKDDLDEKKETGRTETTKEETKKDTAGEKKDTKKDDSKDAKKDDSSAEKKDDKESGKKDEAAAADQNDKKQTQKAAVLRAIYQAEDGEILCGTITLSGDTISVSDKAKQFNGYTLQGASLDGQELAEDAIFARESKTTEGKDEVVTETSYVCDGKDAKITVGAGETATIVYTYARDHEEITPIQVTGEAVDTNGAQIAGDYSFPLAIGTNDLSRVAPYIQGYEYQYAEIGDERITSMDKELLDKDQYAYYVDGELLKEDTKVTYVYQEDENYSEQLSAACGDVTVTLSATKEARIPKNAKLVVNAITGDRLKTALSMSADAMGVDTDKIYGTAYDIYLEADGNRVQPNGNVHVTMKFHNPVCLNLPEHAQVAGAAIIHIHDGVAAEISGTADADGNYATGAEFDTDSFSIYVSAYAVSTTSEEENTGSIDLKNALSNVTVTKVNGETYDPNKQYPRDAKIEFTMKYAFAEDNKPSATGIRKATYTLPQGFSVSDTNGDIDCVGYTSGHAGSYTIKNGVITFEYTEDFLKAHPDYISGDFSFTGELTEKQNQNNSSTTIEFPGNGKTFPLTINLEDGKVTANKNYQLNDDGTIDFTINLEVKGKDVTNVILTDTQGGNLAFADDPQFTLDGTSISSDCITRQGDNGVILNLGNLSVGSHTLTYKARLKDKSILSGDSNKNSANWTWDSKEENRGYADKTVQVAEKKLNKKGSVDKDNNEITWTVIYVPGTFGTVAGKTFTDTLGSGQEYIGKYTVYYDENGNEYNVDGTQIDEGDLTERGSSFSYTFKENQTATKGAYKITYKTKIISNNDTAKETFTNDAEIDGEASTGSAELDNTPYIVEKTGQADSEIRKATWEVKVTPPSGKKVKNLVVVDELQEFSKWKGKYGADITVTEGNNTLTEGTDYTISFGQNDTNGNPTLTVTFHREISNVVKITYMSDYSDSTETGWVHNKAHSSYTIDSIDFEEDHEGSAEFRPEVDLAVNKEGALSKGVATWKVSINEREGWRRVEIGDNVLNNIIDTIPVGMEYVEGSLKCRIDQSHWDEDQTENHAGVTAVFDSSTRQLRISINNLNLSNDRYVYVELEYQTRITSVPEESGNGTTVEEGKVKFTNTVSVGGKEKSSTVELSSKELDKKGKLNATLKNVVDYSITVNINAQDLNSKGDTLDLTDVLDTNLFLDTTSIEVRDLNNPLEKINYQCSFGTDANGRNTMKLIIPDNRALAVTYRATLVSAGKVDGTTYTVSNKATLVGSSTQSVEQNTQVKYEKTNASVTGSQNSITIKKVDENGQALSGAKFIVQRVKPETLEGDEEAKSFSTNNNGEAIFEHLTFNQLYYYQETEAPNGYVIRDGDKHYFIIKDSANGTAYNELINKIKTGTAYAAIPGGNTFTIQNTPGKTSVTVTKAWADSNNQDGIRPANVQVQLYADGTAQGEAVTLDADQNWTYTWTDLDQSKNGKPIAYTVTEDTVEGYTTAVSGDAKEGFTVTNTHTPEKIEVRGTKTWADNNNQDGKRPEKITVHLFADGTEVAHKEVTEADNWTYSFKDLPKYKAGTEIKYTVTEDAVTDYTTMINGYGITNSYTPGKTSVTVTKAWADNNNQDGKRPEKITVHLFADGTEVAHKEVTEADNWSYSFKDLPKYKAGTEIKYTVTEDTVEGYTTVITGDAVTGYHITNTHTPEKIEVKGTKTWADNNNQDGKRPEKITVHLFADGTEVAHKEVTEADNWTYSFGELDKYAKGTEIKYTVTEDTVEGYTTVVSGDAKEGFTVTNTHTPEKIEVKGTKTWADNNNQDGKRPEKITVHLFADGTEVAHKEVTEADNWSYSFKDLPKYKAGTEIKYTVTEDAVEGYTTKVEGYNITNTHTPETVSASMTKTWDDDNNRDNKRPASIAVKLTAKVNGTEILELSKNATLNAANGWKASWDKLPKYHDGNRVEYSTDEVNTPAGYTKSVSGDLAKGFTITNKYTPETVQVAGSKNWNDSSNAAGLRPESITIRLYANGKEIDHKDVTAKENWSWSWKDLKRYDTDHKEISYTISEDAVSGYTTEVNGFNVTNTVIRRTGSVILTKTDVYSGKGLAGAVFDLVRIGGARVGSYTTNEAGLLRVDNLETGDYYFTEVKAPDGYVLDSRQIGFKITADTTAAASVTISATNKPVEEKVGVSAVKVWDDENDADGVRPASVTFHLFADGVEIGSGTASADNGWSVSFGNLPKTREGAEIHYSLVEDEVGNYYEASCETGTGADGSVVFTVKNYRETDKHYEERTGSVRGANRNRPGSSGGVAGAGRGRGTGDETDMAVSGGVAGASLLALIVWMLARKRSRRGSR